jgi:hypothetical protein
MALTPNFDRIVATVTAADIKKFLHSTATEEEKQQVRDAPSEEIRMRFVGGYLIRTKQVTPDRLNPKPAKAVKVVSIKAAKTPRPRKARVSTEVAIAMQLT